MPEKQSVEVMALHVVYLAVQQALIDLREERPRAGIENRLRALLPSTYPESFQARKSQ